MSHYPRALETARARRVVLAQGSLQLDVFPAAVQAALPFGGPRGLVQPGGEAMARGRLSSLPLRPFPGDECVTEVEQHGGTACEAQPTSDCLYRQRRLARTKVPSLLR